MEKALEHGVGIKLLLCWKSQDCFPLPLISWVLVFILRIQIVLLHLQSMQSHWLIFYRAFPRMKRLEDTYNYAVIVSSWSTFLACILPNFLTCVVLYRSFWLVIVVAVHAFLMRWNIFHRRYQKLFSFVLQWYLMARGLLMCLLKRYVNSERIVDPVRKLWWLKL